MFPVGHFLFCWRINGTYHMEQKAAFGITVPCIGPAYSRMLCTLCSTQQSAVQQNFQKQGRVSKYASLVPTSYVVSASMYFFKTKTLCEQYKETSQPFCTPHIFTDCD